MVATGELAQQLTLAIVELVVAKRADHVAALLGEGLKNRQIADRLFISETTVRHHLTAIFSKLEVSDRLELLIRAYRLGLAQRPTLDR